MAVPLPFHETFVDAGPDRPWITLVHGLSQHSGVFSAQVGAFRDRYRLLLVDLPGHGGSATLPGPYGAEEYARSVLAALDHVGIARTHFWGTHTGAGSGLLLASRDASRFHSLILDGAVLPGAQPLSVGATLARVRATAATRGLRAAQQQWFEESEWFSVMRRRPSTCRRDEHWEMIADFTGEPWLDTSVPEPVESIVDRLPSLDVAVLLINGEHDLDDFKATAAQLVKALPNARRVSIPDAGGFPLWEYPDRVNRAVEHFLAEVQAGSS